MISSNIIKSPIYSKKSHGLFTIIVDQTTNIASGDHVMWDTIVSDYTNGDITLDSTSTYSTTNGAASIGRVTLKAGKTYKITSAIRPYYTTNIGAAQLSINNADTGFEIPNVNSYQIPMTASSNLSTQPLIIGYFSPTIDTKIEIRLNGTAVSQIDTLGTFLEIETVESFQSVDSKILYALIEDQKTTTTVGQSLLGLSYNTRHLNTLVHNDNDFVSLSSNQFTIPQGTYRISGKAPSYTTGQNRIALYNITDSVYQLYGTSDFNDPAYVTGIQTNAHIRGRFTIASTKTFEIRHYVGATGVGGSPVSDGSIEKYTQIELWKEK